MTPPHSAFWIGRRDVTPPRELASSIVVDMDCTVRIPRDPPPKKPDASAGLGINLGDVWRKHLEKKKEPKKP